MKVMMEDKYNKDRGLVEINPFEAGIAEFVEKYCKGEMDEHSLAISIIETYFSREFSGTGKHWDRDGSRCSKISPEGTEPVVFDAEETATWDWKDIYSVARASARIEISRSASEIRLWNYSYYVSG